MYPVSEYENERGAETHYYFDIAAISSMPRPRLYKNYGSAMTDTSREGTLKREQLDQGSGRTALSWSSV